MLHKLLMNAVSLQKKSGTWTSGGALITAKRGLAGAGTQTAGLSFGGITATNVKLSVTEE